MGSRYKQSLALIGGSNPLRLTAAVKAVLYCAYNGGVNDERLTFLINYLKGEVFTSIYNANSKISSGNKNTSAYCYTETLSTMPLPSP